MNEIEINGVISTIWDIDEFNDKFIEWIESNGMFFGGICKPLDEDENE